jgi:hypothetical protein
MAKSKVKAHTRRTKSGKQVRVKEGRRKRIGQAAAALATVAGVGLAGKKLGKTISQRKAVKSFKPKMDGPALRDYERDILENSRQALTDSIRKEMFKIQDSITKATKK